MKKDISKLIKTALYEDINQDEDITSSAIFQDEKDHFYLLAKDDGILCGIEIFERVLRIINPEIKVKIEIFDGDKVEKNAIIAKIFGKISAILKAERTALNLLSHLSGIASKTNEFVKETNGRSTILDTRKTLPGLRQLQKYAVQCGGGENHRMGLYDMVMIKDNHIDAAGGIENAVKKIRDKWGSKFKIEVETRNLEEVRQALESGVDRIMLDNMNIETMHDAVELINGKVETEASGNMTIERISEVSLTGVDYISVGELTHTVKAFDFSLKKRKEMNTIDKIKELKLKLGSRVLIPAHHYQLPDIVDLANFVGDSYKLAVDCSKKKSEFIVFCGVRFMAEGAKILAEPDQKILLPDLSAGCPLADHIDGKQMNDVINDINNHIKEKNTPVVYMNSSSDIKEICGKLNGSVCTSSNAKRIVEYYFKRGSSVFFAPDYNLGINTARELGLAENTIIKVKKDGSFILDNLTDSPRIFIWDGNCHVHKRFLMSELDDFRKMYNSGKIIVHPECDEEIVNAADIFGSTAKIYNEIKDSPAGSIWGVGTEYHFVERIAQEFPNKTIVPIIKSICRNMAKINVNNLYQTLKNIDLFIEGKSKLKNQIIIDENKKVNARKSLEKMIEITQG